MTNDFLFIIQWWSIFFVLGLLFLPISLLLFSSFFDKGYIFSKILGIAVISYTVFVLGTIKLFLFTLSTIYITLGIFLILNFFILKKINSSKKNVPKPWKIFFIEEVLFFVTLALWSYI